MKVLVSILILLIQFESFAQLGPLPPLSNEEIKSRLELVDFRSEWSVSLESVSVNGQVQVTRKNVEYTNLKTNISREFVTDFYISKKFKNKNLPVILIFPPLQGLSPFDKGFAKYFAKRGYLAIISHVTEEVIGIPNAQYLMNAFVDSMADNIVLLDYLETQSQASLENLGVFGVSLGGIRASLLYNLDDRFKSGVSIVGGGNLPGILTYSQEKRVSALREKFMRQNEITDLEDYESFLRRELIFDPLYFANIFERKNRDFFLVLGMQDESVNTKYQVELKKSFPDPYGYAVNAGHKMTAAKVFMNKSRIGNYFDARLNSNSPLIK